MTQQLVEWRHPVEVEVRPAERVRAYGLCVLFTFASVPFLHLYLEVDLTSAELLVHSADIALGAAVAAGVGELIGSSLSRGLYWRLAAPRGLFWLGAAAVAAVLVGVSLAATGGHDWLPLTDAVRQRHVDSGYDDMSLRVLPISALIVYLVFLVLRRGHLLREIAGLRALNARLQQAAVDEDAAPGTPRPRPVIELRVDGLDLALPAESIVRVQASENYCEFEVLGEAPDAPVQRHLPRMTFAEVLLKLPPELFLQTHRSHAVGLAHVRALRRVGRHSFVDVGRGGDGVPVSRARFAGVAERLATVAAARSGRISRRVEAG